MLSWQGWKRTLLVGGVFLGVGLVIYAPALGGPFQFDDKRVVEDPAVRDRRSVWGFVVGSLGANYDDEGPIGPRGLVHATFLAQWQMHGMMTWPYHVFNVVVHAITAWLVFWLLRQLFELSSPWRSRQATPPRWPDGLLGGELKFWLSVFGGLVFLVHPVQTQAVAYISQRFESMAAMWYLAAVVLYLKARTVHRGVIYLGAWLAGLMAMSSKETAMTLPIALILIEWLIIRDKLKLKNWLILGLFFLLAVKIPIQIIMNTNSGGKALTIRDIGAQMAAVERPKEFGLTRTNYALTQINVVKTYLRLLIVPVRQSLDYDYPLTNNLWEWPTPVSALILLGLVAVGIYSYRRGNRIISLGIFWWFITLSVSSSFIPIRDVVYEHRVYLSLVGYVIFLVFLIYKVTESKVVRSSWLVAGSTLLVVVYSGLTLARNTVWASEVRLWEDAWKKAPNKARTNKNYGFVLTQEKRLVEGIALLERAVELNPEDQDYRITMGAAYLQVQEWEKAKKQFEKAVALRPDKADGWNNLGVALFQMKQYQEAKVAFEKAIEQDQNFYMAWLGIGGAEVGLGNFEAAEADFERSIELNPSGKEGYINLTVLYIQAKDWQKALKAIDNLREVAPNYPDLLLKRQAILEKIKIGQ